jgi:flavin-binding protein dodecin
MAKKKNEPERSAGAARGRTYKMIELVGTSSESYEAAIRGAVSDASRTLQGLAWFEVGELRGVIQEGQVFEFQAKVKVGFRVLTEERTNRK